MSEESEAEKIKLEDDLKKVMRQLRLFLRIYDPDKYEVDILVVNKADWIKKVEDGYDNVLEVMFRIQGTNLLSAADVEILTKSVDDREKEVVDYITRFNKKILETEAADVENPVHDLRVESITAGAEAAKIVDVDIDARSTSKGADLIQPDSLTKVVVLSLRMSSKDLVAAAVSEHFHMLDENSFAEHYSEMKSKSFMRHVCANYFERGKIKDVRSTSIGYSIRDGKGNVTIKCSCCCHSHCVIIYYSGAGDRCTDVPICDMDQISYPDVVLAETDLIADAVHDEFLDVHACLETNLTWYLMSMIPLMFDVRCHHFSSFTCIKWDTPPHSQVGVDPGKKQIHFNFPSFFRTIFITRCAGK